MGGRPHLEAVSNTVRVRRWRSDDAESLHELLLNNLEHLRPWVAWAASEPVSSEERRSQIAEWCSRWDAGEDFPYAIVDDLSGELLGGAGLHRGIGTHGLEIGYWVRGDRTGRGIATDAVRALVEAAFSVDGITHVEVHHDAANAASQRIPEKLGFTRVGERADEVAAPGEIGTDITWRLDRTPG